MMKLVDDVRLGPAELARKGQVLNWGECLAAKDENLRREECIPDVSKRRVYGFSFCAKLPSFFVFMP